MSSKNQAKHIIKILAEQNPHPATELNFETPWQLLVATILAAQSTDKQVNKVTAKLFQDYPDPASLAALTASELAENIKTLGLFRNKSKHLIATAHKIINKYVGEVPQTLAELQSLPGVGRKTANVVLANAFGIPAFAVDTHVFRVANRTGLADAKNPEQTEKQLTSLIPREQWCDAHHWLILHGRYTCTARKPQCSDCLIAEHCKNNEKKSSS